MDSESKIIMKNIGIEFETFIDLEGIFIPREQLLSDTKYEEIKKLIPELKKIYSSSFMTCLQKNADKMQKWPLINLVRQILAFYNFKMEPIRKADGYTLDGVKKYRRYFLIKRKMVKKNEDLVVISNTNNVEYVEEQLYEI